MEQRVQIHDLHLTDEYKVKCTKCGAEKASGAEFYGLACNSQENELPLPAKSA